MKTFYMLIGLPGTGKSTYLRNFPTTNAVVLSTDDFIEMTAAKQNKTYSEVFSNDLMKKAEKNLHENLKKAISLDLDIIWDQTNLTPNARKKKLAEIPAHYKKVAIYLYCDEEIRKERVASRVGKEIPDFVIQNMLKTFSPPTLYEGFDFIYSVNTN